MVYPSKSSFKVKYIYILNDNIIDRIFYYKVIVLLLSSDNPLRQGVAF